jgi:hypothetical protein
MFLCGTTDTNGRKKVRFFRKVPEYRITDDKCNNVVSEELRITGFNTTIKK